MIQKSKSRKTVKSRGGRPPKKSEKPRHVHFATLEEILRTLEVFAQDYAAGQCAESTLRALTYTGRACASILADRAASDLENRLAAVEERLGIGLAAV